MITHLSVRGRGARLYGAAVAALMTIGFIATQTAIGQNATVSIATAERKHVRQGERVRVRGHVKPADRGRTVLIQHR